MEENRERRIEDYLPAALKALMQRGRAGQGADGGVLPGQGGSGEPAFPAASNLYGDPAQRDGVSELYERSEIQPAQRDGVSELYERSEMQPAQRDGVARYWAKGNGDVLHGLPQETPAIDRKTLERAISALKEYKDAKANLERRIVEEEQWWKLRHWDIIRGNRGEYPGEERRPEPASAWLFNSIAGKHADMMDNYPEPNVLPRELGDEKDAQILSSVLPVIFERNKYEQTYSDAAWYKLKHGVVAKGVFWNTELEDGLGDIDIRYLDLLNIFWEPGITDIQRSRNLFVVDLMDNEILEQQYPELRGKLSGNVIDVKQYIYDDNVDVSEKSVVVDWYYKRKTPEGKTLVHFCKFVGSTILYASENDVNYAEEGYYAHGRYPINFDVLFPEEGTPVGFGYISIMRSPQLYIDKLSQVILENSMMSAKVRYFAKESTGINEEEFLDWSKPIVHVAGDIDEEKLRAIQVQPVSGNVLNVLQMKIDELKETSANRDFSQGSVASGVTAAAAIAALQEAGNKTSRDMIASSYRAFTEECYLAIELVRQFYDEKRSFRIVGESGGYEFVEYDNRGIQGRSIPPAYPGQDLEEGYTEARKKPVFDVVVKPQKRSPYSKMAQNELAKEMYSMGFFNPQMAEQAMTALELMDFDGEEKVKDRVSQGQTLIAQMTQMKEQMDKMGLIIYKLTGNDVLGLTEGGGAPGVKIGWEKDADAGKRSAAAGEETAKKAVMTAYGDRLAARAKPDMDAK